MITNVDLVAKQLEAAVKEFTDVAVVGISGGIDSAVVASIAVAALGKDRVYLISMPHNEVDEQTFNLRSAELADSLGAHHLIVHIGVPTDILVEALNVALRAKGKPGEELHRLTLGNARARVRMSILYGIAGELSYRFGEQLFSPSAEKLPLTAVTPTSGKRVRVMGTGNASEDLLGYDTKGGDALADLFIIGDLFKSEVYQLAHYYQVPKSILEAVPSAGLYEGQTDEQELGYTYDQLEVALTALHRALRRGVKDEDLNVGLNEFKQVLPKHAQFVINRFLANAHKHRAPKVVEIRGSEFIKDKGVNA